MSDKPKYKVYEADLEDFKPDPKNHNKHTLKGHKLVTNSMQNRGYARPAFAANDGTVLGGNLSTMEIAPSLGIGDGKVIVVETSGDVPIIHKRLDVAPDSVEARQLSYEDNFAGVLSFELDPEIVSLDLSNGFNFEAIGVSLEELGEMLEGGVSELLKGDGDTPPPNDPGPLIDKAEELQKKWQVNPNDVWTIGPHKIICGDCRESETWRRLLEGIKVNGVFTSPPYAEQRKKQYGGVPTAEYVAWWEAVQANVRANLAGDGSFFVNIKPHVEDKQRSLYVIDLVCAMVRRFGWQFIEEYIWTHQGYPGDLKYRFKNQFEPVFQFCIEPTFIRPDNVPQPLGESHQEKVREKKEGTGHKYLMEKGAKSHSGMSNMFYYGELDYARPGNVINVNLGQINHGTGAAPFPVALPTFFLKAYSDPGDSWLDPFLGSGTTIAAAHNEGRIGYGIERLEKYVSVCLERLQQLTSLTPIRVSG